MYFITQSQQGFASLCALDTIAIFVAALGHDVGHPAVTNRFLANNRDELAIKYNDWSVLEMMHCSITFEIMTYHDHDIFLHLSSEEWFKARKMIVEMILQTDMSKHFEFLGKFKTRAITLCDISLENDDDKNFILSMALKCADLGHAAKYQELHEKWTNFICEEFFRQGDMERERKQPISVYCDRNDTNVPKSQVGFLKNVALPLYEAWCTYLNEDQFNQVCLEQIKMNIAYWESKCIDRRNTMIIIGKDKDSPKNPAIVKRHSNFYSADFNPKSKL